MSNIIFSWDEVFHHRYQLFSQDPSDENIERLFIAISELSVVEKCVLKHCGLFQININRITCFLCFSQTIKRPNEITTVTIRRRCRAHGLQKS